MEGNLSDYWAQEMIGSDLLREVLEKVPLLPQKNWITIVDWFWFFGDYHGNSVDGLNSGEGLHAILPELGNTQVSWINTEPYKSYQKMYDDLKAIPSAFINVSMEWYEIHRTFQELDLYRVFRKISPLSVIVTAAGNSFPLQIENMKIKASKNLDAILVGSLSPYGFVSSFSQEGEEVYILAPSDHYIISHDQYGNPKLFGGTSGATPLVTGSLAAFEWLSGYHPSPQEAKILLANTALPTLYSQQIPRRNGVGLLNTYKLGMVGKLLREKCQGKGYSCFQQAILNEEYTFDLDKEKLRDDLERVFPECLFQEYNHVDPGGTCEERERVFKQLRQSVLLHSEEVELWKVLSCIYRDAGFSVNAEFVDKIVLSLGPEKEKINYVKLHINEDIPRTSIKDAIIGAIRMGERESIEILNYLIQNGNPEMKVKLVQVAGFIGGEKGVRILEILAQDESLRVRMAAVQEAEYLGVAFRVFKSFSQGLITEVLEIFGREAEDIIGLESLAQDESFE